MTRSFTTPFAVLTVLVGSLVAAGNVSADQVSVCGPSVPTCGPAEEPASPPCCGNQSIRKEVQRTAEYNVSRAEVPTGARVTLYANFLGREKGYAMLNLNGTSTHCEVIDWRDNSTTVVLPKLGLNGPKNVEIQLVKPDGRIVKTFRILLIAQPDILVHGETVPQPMPSASGNEGGSYVAQ